MSSLHTFLKTEPHEQITISRALHKLWADNGIETEEIDCANLMSIVDEIKKETNDGERKRCLESLQEINKMRFMWKELKALMLDADLLRLKDTLRKNIDKSPVYARLYQKISETEIDKLSCDDPLINGIIDLDSNRYQLAEDDHAVLLGEKNSMKRLGKDASIRKVCSEFVANRDSFQQLYRFVLLHSEEVMHDRWVEQESAREVVMKDITDVLLQKIKSNVLSKVTYGSENTLVEAVAHLIEASLHRLPIAFLSPILIAGSYKYDT
ncbi:hypothetical protein C2G38_2188132 [Gigaspora rosea]|uniref:Uncharacterized protein n=1 Tax=Gigaspora rosea TaxID=44941 RepID=A0A397VCW2_9GLOM|nr:hypothetical protein C2G38_2188132 [Gigaspora rosea]